MHDVKSLARIRWRIAVILSLTVVVIYFGFILSVAFAKEFVATEIVPGLSIGILSGALVIVAAWLTTWYYVRWANRHFDRGVASAKDGGRP